MNKQVFNQDNPTFNNYQMNQNQMETEYNLIENLRNEKFFEFYKIISSHNIKFNNNKYENKLIINY